MLIHTRHAVSVPFPCRGLETSLSQRYIRGMARERHGMCKANMAALCKSNGERQSKPFTGTAWHGDGMVCVEPPLLLFSILLNPPTLER
jgi:hypothetical protein